MKKLKNCLNLSIKLLLFNFVSLISFSQVKLNSENFSTLSAFNAELHVVNDINFLVFNKLVNNVTKKPTIIFITGSQFYPFFIDEALGAFPFDVNQFLDDFNFVVVSKPGIPVFANSDRNKSLKSASEAGYYSDSLGNIPQEFTLNNNCNYYVNSHLQVIKYLKTKTWVDISKLYVIGHSQGTKIATQLALKTRLINKLVLLAPANIYSRFHEEIRKVRTLEFCGELTNNKAQYIVDSIISRFKELENNKNEKTKLFDEGTYYSYYSFTESNIYDHIFKIKQKTLILYGTNGTKDIDCDYLQLELVKRKIKNINVVPKVGYDHSFYKSNWNVKNEIIDRTNEFDFIMQEVINWLKSE